ncbi:hypothetical protein NPIL_212731 [Nephila pilipes]|uniref:Uncharacterized protein n=1 Tax=Nephila pilipes TaxID=299642 RepID=A0A8X6MIZ3_NEPPI|nr:hypothetical protein NPIL_212731 [Nephila pilipes]
MKRDKKEQKILSTELENYFFFRKEILMIRSICQRHHDGDLSKTGRNCRRLKPSLSYSTSKSSSKVISVNVQYNAGFQWNKG